MVILILGIAAAGVLMYFIGMGKAGQEGRTAEAAMLAEERIERIIADKKANGFASIALSSPPVNDPAFNPPFDSFTRSVEIYCVNEASLDVNNGDASAQCPGSDIVAKRVKVAVSWAGGAVDLVTVISEH
ncbi:MAG: hypothetical protein HY894_01360 [Deltaproteobacteria bacterium]|nr:hypothetical protein [Deltaproteobacteria bacterium]